MPLNTKLLEVLNVPVADVSCRTFTALLTVSTQRKDIDRAFVTWLRY